MVPYSHVIDEKCRAEYDWYNRGDPTHTHQYVLKVALDTLLSQELYYARP